MRFNKIVAILSDTLARTSGYGLFLKPPTVAKYKIIPFGWDQVQLYT